MLFRILSNNWVAIPVFLVAVGAVTYLYMMGRVTEAKIAGGVLGLAAVLALLGSRPRKRTANTDANPQTKKDGSSGKGTAAPRR
jgi:hypothetical protein